MHDSAIVTDKYLDGLIHIRQPEKGYRAGIDAILLAAAVSPEKNQKILDAGAGVGTVMLAMAAFQDEAQFHGLELQEDIANLAAENIIHNHQGPHVKIYHGNLLDPPPELAPNTFDHVVTNPPYFNFGASNSDLKKTLSRHENDFDIVTWIQACLRMVKPRGYLTMIHRAERLDEILGALTLKSGGIKIYPLWPYQNQPAKLVILQARKSVNTQCQMLPGMILHSEDKTYTQEANNIFRGKGRISL